MAAIGAGQLLADLSFGGVHQRAAQPTFDRDVLGLGREQFAGEWCIIGIPKLVLLSCEGRGEGFRLHGCRRFEDGHRAAIGAFEFLTNLAQSAEETGLTDAARDADVVRLRLFLRTGRLLDRGFVGWRDGLVSEW